MFSTKLDGKIQLEKNSKSSQRSELKELQEEKIWDERDLKRIANTLRTEDRQKHPVQSALQVRRRKKINSHPDAL